jgi:hypothetical protein
MIRVRICTSRCHSSCRRSRFSGLGMVVDKPQSTRVKEPTLLCNRVDAGTKMFGYLSNPELGRPNSGYDESEDKPSLRD